MHNPIGVHQSAPTRHLLLTQTYWGIKYPICSSDRREAADHEPQNKILFNGNSRSAACPEGTAPRQTRQEELMGRRS